MGHVLSNLASIAGILGLLWAIYVYFWPPSVAGAIWVPATPVRSCTAVCTDYGEGMLAFSTGADKSTREPFYLCRSVKFDLRPGFNSDAFHKTQNLCTVEAAERVERTNDYECLCVVELPLAARAGAFVTARSR